MRVLTNGHTDTQTDSSIFITSTTDTGGNKLNCFEGRHGTDADKGLSYYKVYFMVDELFNMLKIKHDIVYPKERKEKGRINAVLNFLG